jgi:nucleoside-diphosphate-sugar epimerase
VEKYPAKEADVTHPNWEYGVSKLAVERYCDIYADYEGFDIASLRYSIVYGKNEWYGRVLTILIKRAIENNDLVIFGKGDGRRDLINVEDVAEFNALLADKEWRGHEIFNVSSGKAVSINELGKIVKDIHYSEAGKKIKVLHEDLEEGKFSHKVKGRMRLPRELKIMHLDNSKAKRFVPWKPTIKLKEGIKQEYHWLKRNPERWTNMSY